MWVRPLLVTLTFFSFFSEFIYSLVEIGTVNKTTIDVAHVGCHTHYNDHKRVTPSLLKNICIIFHIFISPIIFYRFDMTLPQTTFFSHYILQYLYQSVLQPRCDVLTRCPDTQKGFICLKISETNFIRGFSSGVFQLIYT